MQLRMVARRSLSGSLTIVGDIAQATGAWAHETWDEILEHLPTKRGVRQTELTLGYRIPSSNMDLAARVLADLIADRQPRPITPAVILEATAEMYGFTVDDLRSKSRRRPLVIARQVAMYVTRELTDLSYPAIAREFGGRDHTTVMHACDKISALMKERSQIYDQVTALDKAIRNRG